MVCALRRKPPSRRTFPTDDQPMGTVTKDGTEIFYRDWGAEEPIFFHHGRPLSADDWDAQMMFFLGKENGKESRWRPEGGRRWHSRWRRKPPIPVLQRHHRAVLRVQSARRENIRRRSRQLVATGNDGKHPGAIRM